MTPIEFHQIQKQLEKLNELSEVKELHNVSDDTVSKIIENLNGGKISQ